MRIKEFLKAMILPVVFLLGIYVGQASDNLFLKGQLDVAKAVCTNVNIANWTDAKEKE